MTLKFIQDIKAQITAQMPDNSTGLITPAIMRANLQDMTDSLYARAAALVGQHSPALAQALTAVLTKFPALFTLVINNNPGQFAVSLVNGNITALVAGFFYQFTVGAVIDGPINTDVRFALFKNNVQVSGIFGAQTTGAGELVTVQITLSQIGVVINDVFDIRIASVPNQSINFTTLALTATLQPTFSPI